jgi:hypothetical protein
LPYIDIFCALVVFAQEVAVLLVNNCSVDVSNDVIRILTVARVRVITFVPHTTQFVQVFDFAICGVPERRPKYEMPFDENNATVNVITKVYRDFTETRIKSTVWK